MLIAIFVFSILNFLILGLTWALFAWVLISEEKEKQANSKKEKQAAEKQATYSISQTKSPPERGRREE